MANKTIKLEGRVFITFNIEAVTGLHIGGSDTSIEIGGVDKTVIRDPLTNRPYIPGSSLKGKMRSLLEKYRGLVQNQRIGQGYIHSCGADTKDQEARQAYMNCDVCQVFGVPGEREFSTPTRLIVRDVKLSDKSAELLNGRTDLPFTEVKTEVSIDRVTSAANPRQMERVPAGSDFGGERPAELVYSIYRGDDCDPLRDIQRLDVLVEGLCLLEDDYLGGLGSRGSGKVRLHDIVVKLYGAANYMEKQTIGKYEDLNELTSHLVDIQQQVCVALAY